MYLITKHWDIYCEQLKNSITKVNTTSLEKTIELIRKLCNTDGTIWVIGNGGSAATASHFCVDLSKGCATRIGKPLRAIPLIDLVPIQTAWSNDTSYEVALENSLRNFVRKGDLLFCLSGSGNSINILNAIRAAKELKVDTIGLTGFKGGKVSGLVDLEINVPSDDMQIIEDAHNAICHFISREI
jgi:D-sedoheptulose 7-phosphate isomerase